MGKNKELINADASLVNFIENYNDLKKYVTLLENKIKEKDTEIEKLKSVIKKCDIEITEVETISNDNKSIYIAIGGF